MLCTISPSLPHLSLRVGSFLQHWGQAVCQLQETSNSRWYHRKDGTADCVSLARCLKGNFLCYRPPGALGWTCRSPVDMALRSALSALHCNKQSSFPESTEVDIISGVLVAIVQCRTIHAHLTRFDPVSAALVKLAATIIRQIDNGSRPGECREP